MGGTGSVIGGGKFSNGAMTGAFSRLFNDDLKFNGRRLQWRDDKGNVVKEWPARSGKLGSTPADQYKPYYGPLPEGQYYANPKETDHFNWYDPFDRDWWGPDSRQAWGDVRTPINPMSGTQQGQRTGGYFFHGGVYPSSSGCIDLGAFNNDFHKQLENYGKSILLTVDY